MSSPEAKEPGDWLEIAPGLTEEELKLVEEGRQQFLELLRTNNFSTDPRLGAKQAGPVGRPVPPLPPRGQASADQEADDSAAPEADDDNGVDENPT